MEKKRLVVLSGVVCLILALTALPFMGACAKPAPTPTPTPTPTPAPEPEKPIELTYAQCLPPQTFDCMASVELIEKLEAATDGRLKIELFPAGALFAFPEAYDSVIKGVADMSNVYYAYSPGRFPVLEAFETPGTVYNNSLVTANAVYEGYKRLMPIDELSEVHNIWAYGHCSWTLLMATKPVSTIEDFEGMEIRSTGITAKGVTLLGGTPVAMPIGESHEAMKKGTVDGNIVCLEALKTFKYAEVVKSVTFPHCLGTGVFGFAMNLDTWNSLPADIQDIFTEVCDEHVARCGELWHGGNHHAFEWAKENYDIEFIELTPEEQAMWQEVLAQAQDDYIAEKTELGLPAEDIIGMMNELADKYNKIYTEPY